MSLEKRLLEILCCPATRQALRLLTPGQLGALNHAVSAGLVRNNEGRTVQQPFAAALLAQGGAHLYRIDDGIPVLLASESVDPRSVAGFEA
ncbi:MAG: Trm112 family protein [Lysobacteraceae bacterium]